MRNAELLSRMTGAALGLWRCFCAVLVQASREGSIDAIFLYALVELTMGMLSIINAFTAAEFDSTATGYSIPLLYGFGMIAIPIWQPTWHGQLVLLIALVPRMVAMYYLGVGTTCGTSSYVSLCDSGPYAYLRHPMQLSGLVARVGFLVCCPIWWNLFGLGLMFLASVLIIKVEERFLARVSEYAEYSNRVPYRLIPFVW